MKIWDTLFLGDLYPGKRKGPTMSVSAGKLLAEAMAGSGGSAVVEDLLREALLPLLRLYAATQDFGSTIAETWPPASGTKGAEPETDGAAEGPPVSSRPYQTPDKGGGKGAPTVTVSASQAEKLVEALHVLVRPLNTVVAEALKSGSLTAVMETTPVLVSSEADAEAFLPIGVSFEKERLFSFDEGRLRTALLGDSDKTLPVLRRFSEMVRGMIEPLFAGGKGSAEGKVYPERPGTAPGKGSAGFAAHLFDVPEIKGQQSGQRLLDNIKVPLFPGDVIVLKETVAGRGVVLQVLGHEADAPEISEGEAMNVKSMPKTGLPGTVFPAQNTGGASIGAAGNVQIPKSHAGLVKQMEHLVGAINMSGLGVAERAGTETELSSLGLFAIGRSVAFNKGILLDALKRDEEKVVARAEAFLARVQEQVTTTTSRLLKYRDDSKPASRLLEYGPSLSAESGQEYGQPAKPGADALAGTVAGFIKFIGSLGTGKAHGYGSPGPVPARVSPPRLAPLSGSTEEAGLPGQVFRVAAETGFSPTEAQARILRYTDLLGIDDMVARLTEAGMKAYPTGVRSPAGENDAPDAATKPAGDASRGVRTETGEAPMRTAPFEAGKIVPLTEDTLSPSTATARDVTARSPQMETESAAIPNKGEAAVATRNMVAVSDDGIHRGFNPYAGAFANVKEGPVIETAVSGKTQVEDQNRPTTEIQNIEKRVKIISRLLMGSEEALGWLEAAPNERTGVVMSERDASAREALLAKFITLSKLALATETFDEAATALTDRHDLQAKLKDGAFPMETQVRKDCQSREAAIIRKLEKERSELLRKLDRLSAQMKKTPYYRPSYPFPAMPSFLRDID
jgi:hypothetical protein